VDDVSTNTSPAPNVESVADIESFAEVNVEVITSAVAAKSFVRAVTVGVVVSVVVVVVVVVVSSELLLQLVRVLEL
jgi:hypothetical protein